MGNRQELYSLFRSLFEREYRYIPTGKGLDVLVQNGYYRYDDPSTQFEHSREIEHTIHASTKRELEAKVFLLADSYGHVMHHEPSDMIRDWNAWLGKAEYNLGRTIATKRFTPYRFFSKAITHIREAREHGSTSYADMNILSHSYYQLKEYENALHYYLQTEDHDENPHRARAIGSCYLSLEKPAESIYYFQRSLAQAPDDTFRAFVSYLLGRASFEAGEKDAGYDFFGQAKELGFSEKVISHYLSTADDGHSA